MALALCLTLLPTAALAAETEGTAQTPPAVEKAADPANGEEQQENQPAALKQENQSAEQEEQQEDSAAKQAVAAVQAMIGELPSLGELKGMDSDTLNEAYMAVQSAYDAYETLSEEQQAQVTGADCFEELFGWFSSQVAPLEDSGNIYPDVVDADGGITAGTTFNRNGPIVENSDGSTTFYGNQYYVVKESSNVTINGDLIIDSCINNGLILCKGATLTVTGALIHKGGTFPIYGVSNSGENAGRLVIQNTSGDDAAIRSSEENAQLQINSGELEIHSGNSDKLVDGVNLSSTNHIHQGTLDGTALSPAEWGVTSLKGGTLTLAYCTHDNDTYVSVNQTQHKKNCPDCGFVGTAVACGNNGSIGYVSDGANGHYQKCPCGNKFGDVIAHTIETASTNDGKKHTSMCGFCGYTPENGTEAEHSYDENGKCTVCQFQPILQGANGNLYDDLATALYEGETALTLVSYATGDANKGIVKTNLEFDRNATITLDMGGCTLENSTGDATVTVASGTLTVKGDATIEQTGTGESASPAVRVTGGRVIFEGNLTATGANGKPAVEVTGGTLRLKEGDVLNGGVSVEGSTTYANVNALLGENLAFAKVGETSAIVKGDVKSISENVTVVAHTHDFKRGSDGKYVCACGYTCPHNDFKDGKCTICGNRCAHTDVGDDGVCLTCHAQMAVKITASDNTVTYSTDFKAAMNAAENGTKITLLADVSIANRTGISGNDTTVTLDLNGHKITGGWLDVGGKDTNETYTTCTLKIIGKGSYEPPMYGGIITVDLKATLDLSEWEGGTISSINISDNSNYEAATREAAVIVGPKAGTIGKLTFGNNQLPKITKTKLSGGSFNEIWVAGFGPVKLGELLAEGYAYQYTDGVDRFVEYTKTLQGESIFNVKVVKCPHGGKNGFDNNSTNCPYCNAPAVAETALNNGEGSSLLRRFANLQTAIDADRAGGAEFKLLTDVTGDYTIDGTQNTGLDLNGHSIKGTVTVKGIKGDYITTTLSNTENTTTASIDKVVACDGAELAGSKYPAVIGELTLAEGATWKNILNLKTLGYKVLNADGTYKWYAPDDVKGSQLNKVIINSLPITSKTLYLKVNGKNLTGSSPKVERGTTVQLCAYCNTSGANVAFKVGKLQSNGEYKYIELSGDKVEYKQLQKGGSWYYVAEYTFNEMGDYEIFFTASKDNYSVTSGDKKLTVTKLDLKNAVITFTKGNESAYEPYNATTSAPPYTVTYNGKELTEGVDYTVTGDSSEKGAGKTCTLTIKAVEDGEYTGKKTAQWKIVPHKVKVSVGDVIKAYDGTTALPDGKISLVSAGSAFTLDGHRLPLTAGNGYELIDAKYDSANASETEKNISFTVKLTDTNYTFEDGTTEKAFTLNGAELDDKSFEINKAAAPTNIPTGTLNIINGTQQTYTYDFSKLLPELSEGQYGTISYGNQPAISLVSQSGYYYDGTIVEFHNGVLILAQFYAKDGEMTGQIGTVKVNVTTTNYENFQLTLVLNAVNQIKPTPDGKITASKITYGDTLSKSEISGKMKDPDTGDEVKGTFSWKQPGDTILGASTSGHDVGWTFTPKDGNTYTEATGIATVKVDKAQQYGEISMAGYTYGQAPSTPTLTNRTGDANAQVTYRYSAADSGSVQTWDISNPPALNAGTYRMYASIGDTDNYYGCEAVYCEFVVAQATPTYTAPTGLTAKYGQTLADVTLPDGWSWMDSSESVGGASTAAKTFQAKFTPTDAVNYNMVENIGLEVMVNKADGGNLKTVELEQKYTDASDHTYTPDWAGLPAGQDWTFSSEASIVLPKQDFAADGNLLTYAISGGKVGDKITITLKASCNNYEDFTITLTITLTEKDNQQALRITGGTTVVYGQTLQLGTSGGTGSGAVTYTVTNGTGEATIDSNGVLSPVRIGSVTVTATKAGDSEYNAVTSSPVEITITRATPTGEPAYTKITASGKTLADAALTLDGGTISLADGKLEWIDDRGNVLPDETVVEANKTYRWRFTPANGSYTTLTGSIQLWHKSTSSGGGSYYAPTVPDMPMLYRGCTGDAVKTLQDKLNTLGYNSGNVDGIFGAKTYAAVTAFQKANGLGVDGIVGKLTWGKLYDATPVNVTPVTTQPMLRTGSRGDAVRKLQEMLNAKGYTCGSVDGIFGSKTKAAVLAFQKANGLGADGIVGPLTWGKLV